MLISQKYKAGGTGDYEWQQKLHVYPWISACNLKINVGSNWVQTIQVWYNIIIVFFTMVILK